MVLTTPVVLVIFNRPRLTEIVFQAIARAKPLKLLVVADGPRFAEEAERCDAARAVIRGVDWDCEVLTDFSQENLGAGRRIATGLDWVFSLVEEAIVLEDDCLPAPSFFRFCQALLEHYRHDRRIMHIGGDNFQAGHRWSNYSYYFSKYPHSWGWASWQRAWKYFDHDMKTWPDFRKSGLTEAVCEDPYEQKYWTRIFDRMFEGAPVPDVWDYQWTYACWSQNGLSIVPSVNLVSNLGCGGPDATHTFEESHLAQLPTHDILEIRHPPFVVRQREADAHTFDYLFGGRVMKIRATVVARLVGAVMRIVLPVEARRWLRMQLDRWMWQHGAARAEDEQTQATRARSP